MVSSGLQCGWHPVTVVLCHSLCTAECQLLSEVYVVVAAMLLEAAGLRSATKTHSLAGPSAANDRLRSTIMLQQKCGSAQGLLLQH